MSIFPNIDNELEKRNMTYRDLADIMDVSVLGIYRRMTGRSKWQLIEAVKLCRYFKYPDVDTLFQQKARGEERQNQIS